MTPARRHIVHVTRWCSAIREGFPLSLFLMLRCIHKGHALLRPYHVDRGRRPDVEFNLLRGFTFYRRLLWLELRQIKPLDVIFVSNADIVLIKAKDSHLGIGDHLLLLALVVIAELCHFGVSVARCNANLHFLSL